MNELVPLPNAAEPAKAGEALAAVESALRVPRHEELDAQTQNCRGVCTSLCG